MSGQYINGNLLIRNSSCSEINLEECRIEGHVIIDKNKSIVKLTMSEIKGCIIVNYVKDGDFLHLDQLIVKSDQESASKTSSNEHSVLFEKTDMFNIPDSGKVSVLIGDNGELQFEVDENLNANKEKGFKRTILNNNSLFIVNSQIKLNLDSSEIKGDVVIVDSTIASGTFDMSNAKFGEKKNNTTFEIKSTGIASDIEAKKVKFYGTVKFDDIRFDNEIYFSKSKFFKRVKFIDCTMYQECYFEGAIFKKKVDLSETIFQGKASFKDITWEDNAYMKMHKGSAFLGYVDMAEQKLENYLFIKVRGLRNIFYSLIFEGALSFKDGEKTITRLKNNQFPTSNNKDKRIEFIEGLKKWSEYCIENSLQKQKNRLIRYIYLIENKSTFGTKKKRVILQSIN
ncbi:MAG: pentapeptide repeat-containing protein [Saprospiraceae bacterium]|nr:pentapeptide repeat-containing protein [Saprospiraceae bacterium]